ncbi:MFS transporter [Sphaerisporangium aureirubrum]|uniref:MFS transporter n=1 Tax=Sphaerisporangium aureirubrum TaxID=1544736 RepID=A0ABW1NJB8_9ACTN
MTTATSGTATISGTRAKHRAAPGSTGALVLLASITVSLLAASSAPTPLYAVYQAEWGFTPITTTVVFGVYAVAVLGALLVFGRVSDHLGRRPVLLASLAVQAVAMVVFASAGSVAALLVARVVQGLSTGAAMGAIGAGMLDVDRSRGTVTNAVAPGLGTATGALASALLVQYAPAPTHLVYLLLLGVFGVQAVGVLLMRETSTREAGALNSLVPRITLPRRLRGPVLIATPVLFAVWSLAGFYGSLGPALSGTMIHSHPAVYGALGLFVLAGVAALSVLLLRDTPTRTVLYAGILALVTGVAITLVSLQAGSAVGFYAGSAISGVGFGSGFQGGIRLVMPLARPHERAGVLSLLYVVSYLGMGLPAVVAGVLVVHVGGLLGTAREYGLAVIVLAAAALAGLLYTRRAADPVPAPAGS